MLGLSEDVVWRRVAEDLQLNRESPAGRLIGYAFTEMLNNAIDHSGSETMTISWWVDPGQWTFEVTNRTLPGVFKEFTRDHSFVRTRPVVKLFEIGTVFVSRSEARRFLDGLDADFETVEVDFSDASTKLFPSPAGKHPDDHRAGTAQHMHRLITDTESPNKLAT